MRCITLFLCALTAAAQQPNPFAHNAQEAGVGKGIFRIYCAPCHGIRAQGGRGPDLTRGVFNSGEHDADLFHTISSGVPGTEMESYGGVLSDDNIWRVVVYIRSLSSTASETPLHGNAAQGERLFWGKGQCGSCHRVGAKGGSSGPNLSRVGRQRSYAYLRTSITDPGADIAGGYRTVTVVTNDGKKITGVERGLDNFSVQLLDLAGHYYSFDKGAVSSVKPETRSLMPDGYGKRFSAAELDDLVAYLSTLRGEVKQ